MSRDQDTPETTPEESDYNKGYFTLPRQLRADCRVGFWNTSKLVLFIAEQTFGWHSRWVYLSYDEIIHGRKKANGERMCVGSGIGKSDSSVDRAIQDALARNLIEVRQTPYGTLYAIHRRYWVSAKLLPKWALFGRVSYNAIDDPLEDEQPASMVEAEQHSDDEQDNGSAPMVEADGSYDRSKPLLPQKQTAPMVEAATAQQPTQDKARREPIDTSPYTSSINKKIDTFGAPSSRPDVDKVKKEEEQKHEETHVPMTTRAQPSYQPSKATSSKDGAGETEEEIAARAAELEKTSKRHQERARLEALLIEKKQAYDKLVQEELRLWGLVKKATSEEQGAREQELATFREAMAPFLEEIAGLERAWRAPME